MKFKDRVKKYLSEAIDKQVVLDKAYELAGKNPDIDRINKMVDRSMKNAKSEKEAIDYLKQIFNEEE